MQSTGSSSERQPWLGRYEILEEIGRGGMGRVVKARDVRLLRLVAIKIVPAGNDLEFVGRLKNEAQSTAILSHPGIVTVYDVGMAEDSAYIVMEYVSGNTLETRMRYVPVEEWSRFVPVLAQCADALDYAHRKGIVHRDIKPSNIMIRDDAAAKILDFGIAKLVAGRQSSITQAGSFVGTPRYMAPEQISSGTPGPWTDQYALAVVLYTLLAGRPPYENVETVGLIYEIVNKIPPAPSSFNSALSRRVDEVLLKALSKNPAERYSSCRDLFQALQEVRQPPAAALLRAPLLGRLLQLFRRILRPAETGSTAGSLPPAPETSAEAARPVTPPPTPPPSTPTVLPRPGPVPSDPMPAVPEPMPAPGEFTQVYRNPLQTQMLRQPAQQRVDADTIARAQARELRDIVERRDFESAVALRGKWLPGIEGASGELISFSEAARYLGAAQDAVSPHVRIEHLKRAEKVLFSAGNQMLASNDPVLRHFVETLDNWKTYARELLAAAELRAESELPNPFRAGQPLRPDQGRAVFRGRNALVRNIEAILADAEQNYSLALLGPRRCGKTSLLQMLPAMLPDCACVFFDLQDNPVSTVPEFFEALVRRAREQVRTQRRIELPALNGGGTFEAATEWFEKLDQMTEVNRFLISIDEFERLEDLFPGDRRELLRLMGLFRAVIQHRKKVRLLVSGVAPFEELGTLWNDHFINVRELSVGHLDEETSVELLSKPIPEFPADTVPEAVARLIFERTGGQPYLLQLFGALLVNLLNEESRRVARTDDVAKAEEDALSQGRYYFGNTYHDAPPAAREVLEALSRGESPVINGATRRWLERRWLIEVANGGTTLRIPVLGSFIREEAV